MVSKVSSEKSLKHSIHESLQASMLAWCLARNHASNLALDSNLNDMLTIDVLLSENAQKTVSRPVRSLKPLST